MAYLVKQINNLINDSVADALGKNPLGTNADTSDIVSLGKAINTFEAYEGFFKSLANRIVKTVYFIRSYEGGERYVLRDENEFGAFVQKVYYKMPDAVENATWEIPDGSGQYAQVSPFDVETPIAISAITFGGKGTWSIEIIRPLEQIKSAFLSIDAMNAFIDGIYITVENAFKLEEERLTALAVNTSIATSIRGGKSRNLLAEYNALHSGSTLTVADALESASFLRYATKEINRCIKNMRTMSTIFNVGGYETFTPDDNMVVEMLAEFASFSEIYLQSDTYHKELVSLPKYTEVPFWQNSGTSFAFDDTSTIDITNDALEIDDIVDDEGTTRQSGIICFIHDIENVACYFGNRRSWEMANPRSEVMIHGEKAEKGFAVDKNANAFVFYIADEYGDIEVTKDEHVTSVTTSPKVASMFNDIAINATPASGYNIKSVTANTVSLERALDGLFHYLSLSNDDVAINVTSEVIS